MWRCIHSHDAHRFSTTFQLAHEDVFKLLVQARPPWMFKHQPPPNHAARVALHDAPAPHSMRSSYVAAPSRVQAGIAVDDSAFPSTGRGALDQSSTGRGALVQALGSALLTEHVADMVVETLAGHLASLLEDTLLSKVLEARAKAAVTGIGNEP